MFVWIEMHLAKSIYNVGTFDEKKKGHVFTGGEKLHTEKLKLKLSGNVANYF